MKNPKDNPGVIAPPPLLALGALLLGLLLDRLWPLGVISTLLDFWPRAAIGGLLMAGGLALGFAARQRFVAIGTNVNPWKPSIHLVTAGVYRYVRNPMYTGMMLLACGIGLLFASDWTPVMIVPLALVFRYGVVQREERYLEQKFGDAYRGYKASVPRWGIW